MQLFKLNEGFVSKQLAQGKDNLFTLRYQYIFWRHNKNYLKHIDSYFWAFTIKATIVDSHTSLRLWPHAAAMLWWHRDGKLAYILWLMVPWCRLCGVSLWNIIPILYHTIRTCLEWQGLLRTGSPPDFHFLFPWFFHDFPLILPEISLMCFVFITENYTTNYTWTIYIYMMWLVGP